MKVEPDKLYRHKKTGTVYLVIYLAKSTDEPHEDLVVYEAHQLIGEVWVRKLSEFADGRFEPVIDPVSERLPIPCRIP